LFIVHYIGQLEQLEIRAILSWNIVISKIFYKFALHFK